MRVYDDKNYQKHWLINIMIPKAYRSRINDIGWIYMSGITLQNAFFIFVFYIDAKNIISALCAFLMHKFNYIVFEFVFVTFTAPYTPKYQLILNNFLIRGKEELILESWEWFLRSLGLYIRKFLFKRIIFLSDKLPMVRYWANLDISHLLFHVSAGSTYVRLFPSPTDSRTWKMFESISNMLK